MARSIPVLKVCFTSHFKSGFVFRKSPNDTAAEFPTGITPFGLTRLSVV